MPALILILCCQLPPDEPVHEVLLRGYYGEVQRFEHQVELRCRDILAEPDPMRRDAKVKELREYRRDCEALLREIWIQVRRSRAKAMGWPVDLAGV
ncbi:MAG: hypothetical protein O3C40_30935 [Planctomycetota bacterium]|nr:hypothetical protein [Planctomycetota bacterium]